MMSRDLSHSKRKMREALEGTEAEWQRDFIDLCHWLGWKVAHFRPAQTTRGWRTAVQGDGKGFPDNVCLNVRQQRKVWVELKAEGKKLSPEQEEWRDWLLVCGEEWYMFWPSQFDEAAEILRRKPGKDGG